MTSIAAYWRDATYYFRKQAPTRGAMMFEIDEPVIVDLNRPNGELDQLIVEMLDTPVGIQEYPSDWKKVVRPLLAAANVRSYLAFATGAKSITIERTENGIRFLPFRNGGRREGFVPLHESAFTLGPQTDVGEIGLAVRRAFQLAQ